MAADLCSTGASTPLPPDAAGRCSFPTGHTTAAILVLGPVHRCAQQHLPPSPPPPMRCSPASVCTFYPVEMPTPLPSCGSWSRHRLVSSYCYPAGEVVEREEQRSPRNCHRLHLRRQNHKSELLRPRLRRLRRRRLHRPMTTMPRAEKAKKKREKEVRRLALLERREAVVVVAGCQATPFASA